MRMGGDILLGRRFLIVFNYFFLMEVVMKINFKKPWTILIYTCTHRRCGTPASMTRRWSRIFSGR